MSEDCIRDKGLEHCQHYIDGGGVCCQCGAVNPEMPKEIAELEEEIALINEHLLKKNGPVINSPRREVYQRILSRLTKHRDELKRAMKA